MVTNKSAGFTLIEITLAMTISAGLAVIALMGFSTIRGQAQFSNAVDGLKEQVTAVRTEAYTTVNTTGAGNSDEVVLGRMLVFTHDSGVITVKKVIASNSTTPSGLRLEADRTITIPWGLVFKPLDSKDMDVAFIRSGFDGSNVAAYGQTTAWGATPSYLFVSTPGASTLNLRFIDPSGRLATIDIDPSTNGIGRTFQ